MELIWQKLKQPPKLQLQNQKDDLSGSISVFLTSVYAFKLTWLWPDFAQVRVRPRQAEFGKGYVGNENANEWKSHIIGTQF